MKRLFNPAMILQTMVVLVVNSMCFTTPTASVTLSGKQITPRFYLFNVTARMVAGGLAVYLGF